MITTSVLINTYNHAPYIDACVESLFAQTVPPGEIIVYDDGSNDGTVEKLRAYADRLTLIEGRRHDQPPHLGQAGAIQQAFKRSTGKLVFLLDGDDRFLPAKIADYSAAFSANPDASLVQAPMDKIDEHGRRIGNNLEPRKHITNHLREIYRQHDVDFFYPTSALAFSRYYLERVVPLDFSDGLPLWIDTRLSVVAPYFGRVITLHDPLTEWRRHTHSDSIRVRSRRLQLRQTRMRTHVFNAFCRRYGLRTISLWRNPRFYLQFTRYALPESLYTLFYEHIRPLCSRPV